MKTKHIQKIYCSNLEFHFRLCAKRNRARIVTYVELDSKLYEPCLKEICIQYLVECCIGFSVLLRIWGMLEIYGRCPRIHFHIDTGPRPLFPLDTVFDQLKRDLFVTSPS